MPTPGAATDHGKRILAALEHGGLALPAARATRRNLDGLTVGLGVALLLVSVMAWIVYENAKTPALHLQDTVIGAQAAPEPAALSAETPSSERAVVQSEQPAAIINEPAADRIAPRFHEHAPVSATATIAARPQTATTAAAAARPDAPSPTPAATRSAPEQTSPPEHVAAATSIATIPAAAPSWVDNRPSSKPAAIPRKPAASEAVLSAAPTDSDVTLLAAMVAHANGPIVVSPERTRDVVERRDGDSTESLLGRCKLLGTIEGMLCRSRICAGRWDSDTACRAPSH